MAELWGGETRKAVENFPVSGEPIPVAVVHWLGRIKAASARVNAELGLLDAAKAERIAAAADQIAAGEHDDQFPIDVFQTGSGTSSNMNANEVIATIAGEGIHANDDVNMGQSSNDVFPSAVHLAALDRTVNELLPALDALASSLEAKAAEFGDVVKSGRTHLMDAVPITLGQEFAGYAAQVREGTRRVGNSLTGVGQIPLGGTAVGNGLNTHPEFAARVRARLVADSGLEIMAAGRSVRGAGQPRRPGGGLGALKSVAVSLTKIANDLRWMGSGPRAGSREIIIPELQKGSSIMPGKVNPVIPEVVLPGIGAGDRKRHGDHRRRAPGQLRAERADPADRTQSAAVDRAADVGGSPVRDPLHRRHRGERGRGEASGESTLVISTALNPYIGYDRVAAIVKDTVDSGRSLREVALEHGVEESVLDEALNLRKIAAGNQEI